MSHLFYKPCKLQIFEQQTIQISNNAFTVKIIHSDSENFFESDYSNYDSYSSDSDTVIDSDSDTVIDYDD